MTQIQNYSTITAQKTKFSIKGFFSICDQISRKLRIWSHLLKKSLMENFIFCAVNCESLFIGAVEDEEDPSSENEWTNDLLVNQTLVSFKTDSCAQATIIPENSFRTLKNKPKLHKLSAKLTAYNGSSIPVNRILYLVL